MKPETYEEYEREVDYYFRSLREDERETIILMIKKAYLMGECEMLRSSITKNS